MTNACPESHAVGQHRMETSFAAPHWPQASGTRVLISGRVGLQCHPARTHDDTP